MINITPAILESSFKKIENQVNRVKNIFDTVQIDLCDGILGQQKTFPFMEGEDILLLNNLDINIELDLMIDNVDKWIDLINKLNAKSITIHINGVRDCKRVFESINKDIFLAVTIDSDVSEILKWENYIKGIQFMGIKEIGKQGEPFCFKIIDKIKEVGSEYIKSIDGAVSFQNIKELKEAGITHFKVGSSLLKGDVESNYLKLKKEIDI